MHQAVTNDLNTPIQPATHQVDGARRHCRDEGGLIGSIAQRWRAFVLRLAVGDILRGESEVVCARLYSQRMPRLGLLWAAVMHMQGRQRSMVKRPRDSTKKMRAYTATPLTVRLNPAHSVPDINRNPCLPRLVSWTLGAMSTHMRVALLLLCKYAHLHARPRTRSRPRTLIMSRLPLSARCAMCTLKPGAAGVVSASSFCSRASSVGKNSRVC